MSIALVQEVAVRLTLGGSTTKTVTIAAPASGSGLRLLIEHDFGDSVSSVSGGGVTWTQLATATDTGSNAVVEMWGGDNSTGSGTTISIVVDHTYASYEVNVSEWSGLDTTPVTDPAATTNTGTSATITTATVTPTAGKDVLLLAVGEDKFGTVTNSPTDGFTALSRSATAGVMVLGYKIITGASGSYSTTWPSTAGYGPWATIIAGWDAAAAGGGFDAATFPWAGPSQPARRPCKVVAY